jgi:elongation factor P
MIRDRGGIFFSFLCGKKQVEGREKDARPTLRVRAWDMRRRATGCLQIRRAIVIKACNLQKGHIVSINDQPYQVRQIDVHTPSARGANTLYKVRFSAIPTGQKLDQTFKGNDTLEDMDLERRAVSYLYREHDMYTFMDLENYEQYTLAESSIEDQARWLTDGLEGIVAMLLNGAPIAIDLPASVDLEIVETEAVMKGASATNRNKPAVLSNGVTVMVPEYLGTGEIVRVNTVTGKYMSRAKG